MPWVIRPRDRRRDRVRQAVWRWKYDHSQQLLAIWIGAAVVLATVAVVLALRFAA